MHPTIPLKKDSIVVVMNVGVYCIHPFKKLDNLHYDVGGMQYAPTGFF